MLAGLANRSCQRAEAPAGLESVGQLVDIDKMRAGISVLPYTQVVLSVQHEETRSAPLVAVLDRGALDLGGAEVLRVAVQSAVRARSEGGAWGVRLRATTGDTTVLALAPSRFCPPVPLAATAQPAAGGTMAVAPQHLQELERSDSLSVRVLVSRVGNVVEAALSKSSGSVVRDRLVLDAVRRRRFRPARMDGVPVMSWYEMRSGGE